MSEARVKTVDTAAARVPPLGNAMGVDITGYAYAKPDISVNPRPQHGPTLPNRSRNVSPRG